MSTSFTTAKDLSPQLEGIEEEGGDNVVTRVIGMEEILSKILSYEKFTDLRETRLVNNLWKTESEKYFKQLAQVKLIEYYRELDQTEVKHLIKFSKSHKNFALRLLEEPYSKIISNNSDKQVLHFATTSHPFLIKTLRLNLDVYDSKDFNLNLFSLLSNLSSLKELILRVDVRKCWERLDLGQVSKAEQLPQLTNLKLDWNFGRDIHQRHKPNLQKLCDKLLHMTPNLEELSHLWSNWRNREFVLEYLEQILKLQKEWKDSKSKGPMPFQNLVYIGGLHLNRSDTSEKILTSCLELSQPLKGLQIYTSWDHSIRMVKNPTLQNILEKNSITLETLDLNYRHNVWGFKGPSLINLPDLPRLTN